MGTRIVATRFTVPPQIQTAAELAPLIGQSADWIIQRTGVHSRHVAGDLRDPALLAAESARPLIETHGTPDCLIYAGTIPRQMLPEVSVFLHRELGLSPLPSFSVNSACMSFLTAMNVADALLERQAYKRVMICTAELASRGRNFAEPESAALLGDGAAAVLLESVDGPSCILKSLTETWSDGADLACVRGGGTNLPPDTPGISDGDHLFHMDGEQLLRLTVPRLKRFLERFFADTSLRPATVRLVVPHQPSGPAMRMLDRLGFDPATVINIIRDYGNCVAASMPMALAIAEQEGRLRRGETFLLLGTAAGISLGAALVRW